MFSIHTNKLRYRLINVKRSHTFFFFFFFSEYLTWCGPVINVKDGCTAPLLWGNIENMQRICRKHQPDFRLRTNPTSFPHKTKDFIVKENPQVFNSEPDLYVKNTFTRKDLLSKHEQICMTSHVKFTCAKCKVSILNPLCFIVYSVPPTTNKRHRMVSIIKLT